VAGISVFASEILIAEGVLDRPYSQGFRTGRELAARQPFPRYPRVPLLPVLNFRQSIELP